MVERYTDAADGKVYMDRTEGVYTDGTVSKTHTDSIYKTYTGRLQIN